MKAFVSAVCERVCVHDDDPRTWRDVIIALAHILRAVVADQQLNDAWL